MIAYKRNDTDTDGDYLAELPCRPGIDDMALMAGQCWCLVANDPGDPDTVRRELVSYAKIAVHYERVSIDDVPDVWWRAFVKAEEDTP